MTSPSIISLSGIGAQTIGTMPEPFNISWQHPTTSLSSESSVYDIPQFDINQNLSGISVGNIMLALPDQPAFDPDGAPSFVAYTIGEPTLTDVTMPTIPDAPEFGAALPEINLDIAVPATFSGEVPLAPELVNIELPAEDAIVLPDVPTLDSLGLPSPADLEIPSPPEGYLNYEDLPVVTDMSINFTEDGYSSALQTRISELLVELLDTSTGLAPAVEDAIWRRQKERVDIEMSRAEQEIRRDYGARGFPVPQGVMDMALAKARQEAMTKNIEASRDISIAQAELEQKNRQAAIQFGLQNESQLIGLYNNIAQRRLEVDKINLQVRVDIYNLRLARFNAQIELFKANLQSFNIQIQGKLAILELFKANLEREKLAGELNMQRVEVYKAQLAGVSTLVEIYKSRVQGAMLLAEINKNNVAIYGERVRAYQTQVQAKAVEFDAYAKRIEAEVKKADIYKAQADAYNAVIQGYSAKVDGTTKLKGLEVEIGQRVPLEAYKSQLEGYRTAVEAEAQRVNTFLTRYRTDAEVYSSVVRALVDEVNANTQRYSVNAQVAMKEGDLRVANAEIAQRTFAAAISATADTRRAMISAEAQVQSASISTYNYSESVSNSFGRSYSMSENNSRAAGYSESAGTGRTETVSFDGGEIYSILSQF